MFPKNIVEKEMSEMLTPEHSNNLPAAIKTAVVADEDDRPNPGLQAHL